MLTDPSFSAVYGQVSNPMDPPVAPEIVSEATGSPLIHRVVADGNQVIRDTADFYQQNLPARQNDWDALPAYHPHATANERTKALMLQIQDHC